MSDETNISSQGSLCAPITPYWQMPTTWTHTYRVQGVARRWWLRRNGWSTEWRVEEELGPITNPIRDSLPMFTVPRGGIDWTPKPAKPYVPPTRWEKARRRAGWKVAATRTRLALRLDPSLRRDPYE